MLSPAYNRLSKSRGKSRIYKDAIARKVDEIFELLEKTGYTHEEKDEEGQVTQYTIGFPETLPSLSWYYSPLNWLNKQFTSFIRFPVALAPDGKDPKSAFCHYAKTQIRDQYINGRFDEGLSDSEIKMLLSPFSEGTLSVLASSFSRFFTQATGVDIVLKPSSSDLNPLHYILEGKDGKLTASQKLMILNWCIANQPAWVVRWWRDDPFDKDSLKMDEDGQLCIESYDLLKMTMVIDPEIPQLLNDLGEYLKGRYNKKISLNINDVFASSDIYLNAGDDDFCEQFKNDLLDSTKCYVEAHAWSYYVAHPVSVSPYNPSQIMNADNTSVNYDPLTIKETRFNRKFIAKNVDLEGKGVNFPIEDLRVVLAMARMEAPAYLPLNAAHAPKIEHSIKTHPILLTTNYRLVGASINGIWVTPNENKSNNNDDWGDEFKKALGLTESKQSAKLK